jgi:signal transduction histidine kinase
MHDIGRPGNHFRYLPPPVPAASIREQPLLPMGTQPGNVRAPRFDSSLPIRFKTLGSDNWRDGLSSNLSCTGVLFRTRARVSRGAPISILLPLPEQVAGSARVVLRCQGTVARVEHPPLPLMRSSVAVAFSEWRVDLTGSLASPFGEGSNAPSIISHRLNNALSVILGNAELLLAEESLPNKARDRVSRIVRAAQTAARLVISRDAL